jgi:DNA-binding LacI/PurR family transcriptional regulator
LSTIRDIARRARVSVSTASLAVNGDHRVRPETRQRVLEAVRELDFHPARAARSLASGRTCSLQLLNPVADTSLSSGFFTRFARGIHDLAREHGYSLALSILDDESEAQAVLDRLINERWVDGVILMNPSENEALLDRLVSSAFPHVLLGRGTVAGVTSVDNDNVQVARDATLLLLERAPGPVLFLNGEARQTFAQDRAEGYRQALRAAGAPRGRELIDFVGGPAERARRRVEAALEQGRLFRSVLAASDALAVGAMQAIRKHGLAVPGDVAVMGMNNDDVAEFASPRLSSVELNAYDLGRSAAGLVLEGIAGRVPAGTRHLVPHRLILRESC